MKIFRNIATVVLVFGLGTSCEKVIDVDINDADQTIVIEATVTDRPPYTVYVSKTTSFFSSSTSNPVSGAVVSIKSENGKTRYFRETSPGQYTLDKVWAIPEFWYTLEVVSDSVTYSAKSYMNRRVPILDLSFSYYDGLGFFDDGYTVHCFIHDPIDEENYYRLKYYINGKPTSDSGEITVYSDKLFNGKQIGLGQRTLVFDETDTLTVELQSIDKAAYDYLSTLGNITSSEWEMNAAPANPISNFNNGALGYFSAYTYDQKTVILKDYLKARQD